MDSNNFTVHNTVSRFKKGILNGKCTNSQINFNHEAEIQNRRIINRVIRANFQCAAN